MTTTFTPQILGETEKALNAILDRLLAGTGLNEQQWVALTLTVVNAGSLDRDQLVARISGGLKVAPDEARTRLGELVSAGLVSDDGQPTAKGREVWTKVRGGVTRITESLYGDLPADQLAVAGSVLSTVLLRANALLAA